MSLSRCPCPLLAVDGGVHTCPVPTPSAERISAAHSSFAGFARALSKWVSRFVPCLFARNGCPGLSSPVYRVCRANGCPGLPVHCVPVYCVPVYCVAVPVCRPGLLVVQEQQKIAGEEYHTPATRYGTRIDSKVSPALIAARIQSGRLPMPAQVCSGFLGFA